MTGYRGVLQIVRFNWHWYALAAVALLFGRSWPVMWLAGAWGVASLAVSHYVYDRSRLGRWDWLPVTPGKWANIHCGFDETSRPLRRVYPGTTGIILDMYDRRAMTEASIARARRIPTGAPAAERARYDALPVADGELDTVFVLFAAHELRARAAREKFFAEVDRVLRPGGRVVLVEHLRDAANFLAFGPGAFHFLPGREWRRLAARWETEAEFSVTPFVRAFVFRKERA